MGNLRNIKVFNLAESIYALGYSKLTDIPDEEEFNSNVDKLNELIQEIEENPDITTKTIYDNEYFTKLLVGLTTNDPNTDIVFNVMVSFDVKFESSVLRMCMSYGMLKNIYNMSLSDENPFSTYYSLIKDDIDSFPLSDLLITGKYLKEAEKLGKV